MRPRFAHSSLCRRRHNRRSEEHTSELQSRLHLVCRLLLEKKKKIELITVLLVIVEPHYKGRVIHVVIRELNSELVSLTVNRIVSITTWCILKAVFLYS